MVHLQALAVVGAAQGNGWCYLLHEICSVTDPPTLERCLLCVTSRQIKFSRVYVCHSVHTVELLNVSTFGLEGEGINNSLYCV